jgi:hypothetical protein
VRCALYAGRCFSSIAYCSTSGAPSSERGRAQARPYRKKPPSAICRLAPATCPTRGRAADAHKRVPTAKSLHLRTVRCNLPHTRMGGGRAQARPYRKKPASENCPLQPAPHADGRRTRTSASLPQKASICELSAVRCNLPHTRTRCCASLPQKASICELSAATCPTRGRAADALLRVPTAKSLHLRAVPCPLSPVPCPLFPTLPHPLIKINQSIRRSIV